MDTYECSIIHEWQSAPDGAWCPTCKVYRMTGMKIMSVDEIVGYVENQIADPYKKLFFHAANGLEQIRAMDTSIDEETPS